MNIETFWLLVEKTETCWLWKGKLDKNGYGKCAIEVGEKWSTTRMATHVAYEQLVGPVPPKHVLHHVCKNRRCVNVLSADHVIPQLKLEHDDAINTINKRKTHCPRGHEYTRYFSLTKGIWFRKCITCEHERKTTHSKME